MLAAGRQSVARALRPLGLRSGWLGQGARCSSDLAEAYKAVAPNLDPPSTPTTFLQGRPEAPATIPEKLTFNLVVPHELPFWNKEVSRTTSARYVLVGP